MSTPRFRRALTAAATSFLLLTGAAVAHADVLLIDGDYAAPVAENALALGDICTNASKDGDALLAIKRAGSGNQVFPNSAVVTVSVKTPLPANVAATMTTSTITLPANWSDLTNTGQSDTVSSKVTVDATGLALGSYTQTVSYEASGGGVTRPGKLGVTFNVVTCTPTNRPPVVTADQTSVTVDEGSSAEMTGTWSDQDSDDVTLTASYGTVMKNADGTWSWTATPADGPATSTVTITADDGNGGTASATFDLTVANVAPDVTTTLADSVDCRANAALSLSFADPGVNDADWTVAINWGDGSPDTTYSTDTQGAQTAQSHLYTTPGTYTVTATVTDKDGGEDTSIETVEVKQVYTAEFLAPFNASSPSELITNTMKNGRVVPVKLKVYDVCTQSYVTDPATAVSIKVTKVGTASGTTADPVETYADAGQSSAGTNLFRWSSDGFWIYNLDSKALGLTTGSTYRIDAFIGAAQVTSATWALVTPTK